MKKLNVILCTILFCFSVFGEDAVQESENINPPLKHYIGAGGGLTLGYGLTYRYWPGKFGGQLTFAPYIYNDEITFCIGTAGLMELHETEYTRLFLYTGGSYEFSMYDDWDTVDDSDTTIDHAIAAGIGPGLELILFENFSLNLMFGYGYNTNSGLSFTGEGFIFYRF